MSWEATTWVIKHSRHKGSDLLTLLILANQMRADGRVMEPSVKTLAEGTRLTERAVRGCLRRLELSGELLIRKGGGRGRVSEYVLPTLKKGEKIAPFTAGERGQVAAENPVSEGHLAISPPDPLLEATTRTTASTAGAEAPAAAQTLLGVYDDLFSARFGQRPVISGGKDGTLLKRLERQYGRAKVEELLKAFFFSDDPWIMASGYTVGAFHASVNKLLAQEAQGRAPVAQARAILEMVTGLAEAKRLR